MKVKGQPSQEYKMHELPLFAKRGITLVKGNKAKVYDDTGKQYIDCITGQGVGTVGHSVPEITQAIQEQASELMICSAVFDHPARNECLQALQKVLPEELNQVFFCNSGTESIEAAIKFARASTKKRNIVCARRGYHGRTQGALSATFKPQYKKPFAPLVSDFEFAEFNNSEDFEKRINNDTCAVLLEVIQGEGGVYLGKKDFFKKIRALCDKHNVLLIFDEVQTGFCRTGSFFAFEQIDVIPDVLCLAKSCAAGVPMGMTICNDKIEMSPGLHGSTFGGNPLACVACTATINYCLKEDLAKQAKEKGTYLLKKLQSIVSDNIVEVRGQGLIIGIECTQKVTPYLQSLMSEGILALPAGAYVLRLLPPATISYEQLDEVVEKIKKIF